MRPAGAAVRCAAGFEVDEGGADSLPAEVEDSLFPSVVWLLAGPVVVMLVTRVEPLEVTDDSITPVVTDPDSVPEVTLPEAEAPEVEKTVLVTAEVTGPLLPLMVVETVSVVMGTTTPVPEADSLAVIIET